MSLSKIVQESVESTMKNLVISDVGIIRITDKLFREILISSQISLLKALAVELAIKKNKFDEDKETLKSIGYSIALDDVYLSITKQIELIKKMV